MVYNLRMISVKGEKNRTKHKLQARKRENQEELVCV